MYLHIGGDVIVPFRDIVGVFDIVTSDAAATREFLQVSREEGFIQPVVDMSQIKSFIVADNKIYLSPIACSTLRKRWMSLVLNTEEAGP